MSIRQVCLDHKFNQDNTSTNMVISEAEGEQLDLIIFYLLFLVCHSPNGGWTMGPIFMYVRMLLCYLNIRSMGLEPCLWGIYIMHVFLVLI